MPNVGNIEGVSVVCAEQRSSSEFRSCLMRRMTPLSVTEDQIDAILPVAGTLAALIVLLVVLVASAN
jgi:hypothetical protein